MLSPSCWQSSMLADGKSMQRTEEMKILCRIFGHRYDGVQHGTLFLMPDLSSDGKGNKYAGVLATCSRCFRTFQVAVVQVPRACEQNPRENVDDKNETWATMRPKLLIKKSVEPGVLSESDKRWVAVYLANKVRYLLPDERSINVIDVATRYAGNNATWQELTTAYNSALAAVPRNDPNSSKTNAALAAVHTASERPDYLLKVYEFSAQARALDEFDLADKPSLRAMRAYERSLEESMNDFVRELRKLRSLK